MKSAFLLLVLAVALAGCQTRSADASSGEMRRARLVGNENISLKKTIAEKDSRIADLQKQLEEAQAENDRITNQHGETYKGLMEIIVDCQTKLDKYEQQN